MSDFQNFVFQLTWSTAAFQVRPAGELGTREQRPEGGRGIRSWRPGLLLHALLGPGLRAVACRRAPPCLATCAEPQACGYAQIMEPAPPPSGLLKRVARAPLPVAFDVRWRRWFPKEPLAFRVHLLGCTRSWQDAVSQALQEGFATLGESGGVRCELAQSSAWKQAWLGARLHEDEPEASAGDNNEVPLQLLTPLRLVKQQREVAAFDFPLLVRNLSFRLAVWGHHYDGLAWPEPWVLLHEEAETVQVKPIEIRQAVFSRYSTRQQQQLRMAGFLGSVKLGGLTPSLITLLRLGEICGAGKGASLGLGRFRLWGASP
jgi:CRISPR-associated endoribonuclease Cas6